MISFSSYSSSSLSVWSGISLFFFTVSSMWRHGCIQAKDYFSDKEAKSDIWLLSEGGAGRGGSSDPLPGNGRSGRAGWNERWRPHPPCQWNICWWTSPFRGEQGLELLQCINQINNGSLIMEWQACLLLETGGRAGEKQRHICRIPHSRWVILQASKSTRSDSLWYSKHTSHKWICKRGSQTQTVLLGQVQLQLRLCSSLSQRWVEVQWNHTFTQLLNINALHSCTLLMNSTQVHSWSFK